MATCLFFGISSQSHGKDPSSIPKPIETFEIYCFQTQGNYRLINEMAQAVQLEQLPEKYKSFWSVEGLEGRGYIVKNDRKPKQTIFLAATEANTCSVYANGFDTDHLLAEMRKQYKLETVFKQDIGLQVNELLLPRTKAEDSTDNFSYGAITFMYPKNEKTGATLGYLSPEATREALKK